MQGAVRRGGYLESVQKGGLARDVKTGEGGWAGRPGIQSRFEARGGPIGSSEPVGREGFMASQWLGYCYCDLIETDLLRAARTWRRGPAQHC